MLFNGIYVCIVYAFLLFINYLYKVYNALTVYSCFWHSDH